uniref:Uncharacterized protein n=1 Tax=Periophthalmus magnuspinnatus TaxID=409849 RepID=A0A3B4A504_9GOBI
MKECSTWAVIVLSDLALGWAYWTAALLLQCPDRGGLVGLWGLGVVKYIILYFISSLLADHGTPEPALRRLSCLLCLLCPVTETGRMLLSKADRPYVGPHPDLTQVPLSILASLLACIIWEKGLSGERSAKTKPQIQGAGQLFKRLLPFFKPDVFYLITAFSALIVGVICDTFIPKYQGEVIDMLKTSVIENDLSYAIAKLAFVSIGSAVFSGTRGGLFMFILSRLNRRLKHLLFHTLLQQEIQFFEENNAGKLSSRLHSDVDRMGRTVALNANVLVRSTVKTCLMLVVMVQLSWELTVLTVLEMPILGLVQNKYTTISQLVLQTVSGIETVRSYNAENVEIKRYNAALEQLRAVKRQYGIYSSTYTFIRRVSIVLALQCLKLFFLLFEHLCFSLLDDQSCDKGPFFGIMYGYGDTKSSVGVISTVFSYLNRKPKRQTAGDLAPQQLEGRIIFENVSFTYPSASSEKTRVLLTSFSCSLRPGQMTALVGPSGSGKTTCVSLLKRLYEPQEGQILLDGEPLHKYELKYLHNKMAVVSQNPVLFCGSLKYNIEYGLTESNTDKVQQTARKINAESFFSELDNGYDTDVGESGSKLSEGLKQSIAILRALIRDPKVIILDEATSKLDVLAQHASCLNRTVLVIAHHLKTVEKADCIIFLENGEIVEEGTHRKLMDKRGRYYSLKEELFKQGNSCSI